MKNGIKDLYVYGNGHTFENSVEEAEKVLEREENANLS